MKTISFQVPTMFGDHHVTEVRRLLLEAPGVEEVYASSGFQVIEVSVDESKVKEDKLKAILEEAGYLGELSVAVEREASQEVGDEKPYFRHSVLFEQTKGAVGFTQKVGYEGSPLWPCPGMGPLKTMDNGS